MRHDCAILGHVLVDSDALGECLVCGEPVVQGDRIGIHVHRCYGELEDPRSVASFDEFGHANTRPT